MKKLLYFLGSLLATAAAAFFVSKWLQGYDNPGYVLIGIGHWSLETSLVVFAVSLIIGFFVFICSSGYWDGCSDCPDNSKTEVKILNLTDLKKR